MIMKAFLLLSAFILTIGGVASLEGLTEEQEKWLWSVSHGNVSAEWPLLSAEQNKNLLLNVQAFQNITEHSNYPYNQAVEVWYTDRNRSRIAYYDDVGDGAAWTGLHLAALAHQYVVTNDPIVMGSLWNTLEAIDLLSTCTGKNGYIARFAGPATDPAYAKYYVGYTNGHHACIAPHTDYVWLDASTRDMYYGVAFGLTNAWVWMKSNATVLNKVQTIVERVVDLLRKDKFWIISPHNKIANPLPLFSATWRKLALTVNFDKYKDMELAYAADFILAVATEMKLSSKHPDSYFPNELMVEGMYILSALEDDADRKKELMEKFTDVAVGNYDHLQPGFAAFYLSVFPNTTQHKIPQGILQGGLFDYPAAPDWEHTVDQSTNPKYMPHYSSEYSDYALLIRDRPPTTYFWQRAPTKLKGGTGSCCLQRKHLDLVLAYWIGRSSGYMEA